MDPPPAQRPTAPVPNHPHGRKAPTVACAADAASATGAKSPSDGANARDLQLVRAAHEGDRAAMSTLLVRYQDRLYAVCLRMVRNRDDAAELTQSALLKLIRNLDQFDGRSAFATWAIRVAMNLCLSHLRGARLRRHARLDVVRQAESQDQTDAASSAETMRGGGGGCVSREQGGFLSVEPGGGESALSHALAALEAQQRAILLLRDVRGLDYDQIAYVLDVPVGTVKSRLFRARAALRAALEGEAGGGSWPGA